MPLPELSEQCRNRWCSILPHFGIEAKFLSRKQGPCPVCGGKDRYRFDNKDGAGTWICNACGAGDGAKLVMLKTGLPFKDAADRIREVLPDTSVSKPPREMDQGKSLQLKRELWGRSRLIDGTDAEHYLRSRCIFGPYPKDLRFSDSMMIALVRNAHGKPVSIHRTMLRDGYRTQRKMMPGRIPPGSSVWLSDPAEIMGVAEGIETAMRASQQFGIPVFSAINSTLLEQFDPPDGCKKLVVFGDNDAKFGGQKAAYALAYRHSVKPHPIEVEVRIPEQTGTDWADG